MPLFLTMLLISGLNGGASNGRGGHVLHLAVGSRHLDPVSAARELPNLVWPLYAELGYAYGATNDVDLGVGARLFEEAPSGFFLLIQPSVRWRLLHIGANHLAVEMRAGVGVFPSRHPQQMAVTAAPAVAYSRFFGDEHWVELFSSLSVPVYGWFLPSDGDYGNAFGVALSLSVGLSLRLAKAVSIFFVLDQRPIWDTAWVFSPPEMRGRWWRDFSWAGAGTAGVELIF